ncbi:MAG: class I SAM-dependent methyltransferase, partial [Candidatus Ratteibacteria bacterium]|nr:class I SAM-dependent methyltransferase [Candidatus Ratteibacteria bacterium]
WQLKLASRSLKKREKLKRILSFIKPKKGKKCLEIGCEKGVLGHFLRQQGGNWYHSDIDRENVTVTKSLLRDKVFLIDPKQLNFYDHTFDCVLAVDFLEHIEDDELFLKEVKRILKRDGSLYITVPKSSRGPILNWLERKLGITADFYGHIKDGYNLAELKEKLERLKMNITAHSCYSFFVTEFFELLLNAGYVKFSKTRRDNNIKGGISPSTSVEFKKSRRIFRVYSLIYPVLLLFSQLDRLYQTGYVLMLEAKNEEIT